jgi:hypothetical protein
MTDKAKHSGAIWFVRGIPPALRVEVAEAADRAGMKVGPWVERALRAALAGSGRAADPIAGLARRLDAVEARLAKLGQREAALVEEGVPVDVMEAMEAEPAAVGPTDRQQRRRPWTAEDDAALQAIAARGGTQADAMKELQMSSGAINSKWQSLSLPVEPRKGRKLGPRRKRTA